MRENCIEWLNGQDRVTVTLSQGRLINKVKKLAEKYREVEIVKENEDGTLLVLDRSQMSRKKKPENALGVCTRLMSIMTMTVWIYIKGGAKT